MSRCSSPASWWEWGGRPYGSVGIAVVVSVFHAGTGTFLGAGFISGGMFGSMLGMATGRYWRIPLPLALGTATPA